MNSETDNTATTSIPLNQWWLLYSQVQESARCLFVNTEQLHHYQVRKGQWRNFVQYGTSRKLEKEIANVTEKMTIKAIRSIKKSQLKESAYVRKCSLTELTELLKLRLHVHMAPRLSAIMAARVNVRYACWQKKVHMLECPVTRMKVGYEINASMNTESKSELKEISRYMESVIKIMGRWYTSSTLI